MTVIEWRERALAAWERSAAALEALAGKYGPQSPDPRYAPPKPPVIPPITPPVTPPITSGINYSLYAGMTPQEIQGSFGPFQGRGLPAGWNWEEAYASGVVNPDANRPPPPPVQDLVFDRPAFDWTHPGSWRRFRNGTTKTLAVPVDGLVGLFVSAIPGNAVSHVRITVRDGVMIVGDKLDANTTGDWVKFQAQGGKTYAITVEGEGAVVSINFVPGG